MYVWEKVSSSMLHTGSSIVWSKHQVMSKMEVKPRLINKNYIYIYSEGGLEFNSPLWWTQNLYRCGEPYDCANVSRAVKNSCFILLNTRCIAMNRISISPYKCFTRWNWILVRSLIGGPHFLPNDQ